MYNLIQTILRFILATNLFILGGCEKNNIGIDDTTEIKVARLKHITTEADINTLLNSLQQDYTLNHSSFTNIGSYPIPPYRFYYDINWSWNVSNHLVTAYRTLSCSSGFGNDSKEEILRQTDGFVEILDERLGNSPYNTVFAIKRVDQKKSDWRFGLYILKPMNNMNNQNITLTGSYGPVYREDIEAMAPTPPEDNMVITELLKLLEVID